MRQIKSTVQFGTGTMCECDLVKIQCLDYQKKKRKKKKNIPRFFIHFYKISMNIWRAYICLVTRVLTIQTFPLQMKQSVLVDAGNKDEIFPALSIKPLNLRAKATGSGNAESSATDGDEGEGYLVELVRDEDAEESIVDNKVQ